MMKEREFINPFTFKYEITKKEVIKRKVISANRGKDLIGFSSLFSTKPPELSDE